MTDTLERLTRELVERLSTEVGRPTTAPSTHLVGGIVKACAKLEQLLRELVIAAATVDGVDVRHLLAIRGGKPPHIKKATAGLLARSLEQRASNTTSAPLPAAWAPFLADLAERSSIIFRFINLRNEIAKEGGEPRNAQAAMNDLRSLVLRFQSNAQNDRERAHLDD